MKLLINRSVVFLTCSGIILSLINLSCNQKTSNKLLSELPPQVFGGSLNENQVKDFEQNFIWFYKAGGINSTLSTPTLMFDVTSDLFGIIDTTNWTEPSDTGLVFYYAIASTGGGDKYFTYLMTNAYRDVATDSIIPIGLYDNTNHTYNANKYLRLNHNQSPATTEVTGKQNYVSNYIALVSMNQITDTVVNIDTLPYHPHLCFYNLNSLYYFYNDNRSAIVAGTNKLIEVKHGAINNGLLPNGSGVSKCKVQTPILIFDIDGLSLLGNQSYFETPFKNHALDVGNLCPPGNCSCY